MRQAQAQLAQDGLTTTDRYGGVKPHPAVTIEERSRIALLRDGIDLELYQSKLARFFARFAPTAEDPATDLRYARIEDMDP